MRNLHRHIDWKNIRTLGECAKRDLINDTYRDLYTGKISGQRNKTLKLLAESEFCEKQIHIKDKYTY